MTERIRTHCALCQSAVVVPFAEDKKRSYLRCAACGLVFVPGAYLLSAEAEKAIYDWHENDVEDQGYRQFLSRLSTPLLAKLLPHQQGLDFGCGPGPALAAVLEEAGHQVDLYDPFYRKNSDVFDKSYDFICATEVAEHLHDPYGTFTTLFRMLKPGGWLGLMTKMQVEGQVFERWHYIRDPTHVCFYHRTSFEYLAQQFGAELTFVSSDVILLQKK